MLRIGVLALQGGFAVHARALAQAGVTATEVRRVNQLAALDGLVLPGGESTTLLNLMSDEPWFESLRLLHARNAAMLATCAGAIVLAREVTDPPQPSVGLLDAVVQRNAYGRQADSFETDLEVKGWGEPLPAIFIRAPRFGSVGPAVEVLACLSGEPVLVQQGSILAATFHPELSADVRLHRRFVELAKCQTSAPSINVR